MKPPSQVFEQLMLVVEKSTRQSPATIVYDQAAEGGVPKIGAKILEEASGLSRLPREPAGQSSESAFHLRGGRFTLSPFRLAGTSASQLNRVSDELARRFGTSGLDEKASRPNTEKDQNEA